MTTATSPHGPWTLRLWLIVPLVAHLLGLGYVAVVDAPMLAEAAREQRGVAIDTKSHAIRIDRDTVARHHAAMPWLFGREGAVLLLLTFALALVHRRPRWGIVIGIVAVVPVVWLTVAVDPVLLEAHWRHAKLIVCTLVVADLSLLLRAAYYPELWWSAPPAVR